MSQYGTRCPRYLPGGESSSSQISFIVAMNSSAEMTKIRPQTYRIMSWKTFSYTQHQGTEDKDSNSPRADKWRSDNVLAVDGPATQEDISGRSTQH